MSGLAIVGASERTIWTEWLTRTLDQFGYPEPVFLVNPRYQEVLGQPCHPSVAELPERPSVVLLCVSATRSLAELEGLLELGVEEVVVIANGFGETGTAEGRAREAELRATCAGSSTRVIGPNCIGFARFHERLCAIAQPVPANVRAGDVSVISQSGGLSGGVLGALASEGLGIDLCYSIGNGVCFGVEQALRVGRLARDHAHRVRDRRVDPRPGALRTQRRRGPLGGQGDHPRHPGHLPPGAPGGGLPHRRDDRRAATARARTSSGSGCSSPQTPGSRPGWPRSCGSSAGQTRSEGCSSSRRPAAARRSRPTPPSATASRWRSSRPGPPRRCAS